MIASRINATDTIRLAILMFSPRKNPVSHEKNLQKEAKRVRHEVGTMMSLASTP